MRMDWKRLHHGEPFSEWPQHGSRASEPMRLLLDVMQVTTVPGHGDAWESKEVGVEGASTMRYAYQDSTLSRTRTAYTDAAR